MDRSEFKRHWAREGYGEFQTSALPANHSSTPHAHPHDVAALVLDGEITVTCNGVATTCRKGDTFTMARGTEHFENIGAQGVEYIVAKRPA